MINMVNNEIKEKVKALMQKKYELDFFLENYESLPFFSRIYERALGLKEEK